MPTASGSICLVANELSFPEQSGSIGSYFGSLAHVLADSGWRVHVLCVSSTVSARLRQRMQDAGITVSMLGDFELPKAFQVPGWLSTDSLDTSERVRHALERLHQQHRFDLVEFADWRALGFRAIQAQRAGLTLKGARTIVKLRHSSPWLRETQQRWMESLDDLRLDFCERHAFEHADVQMSASLPLLDHARSMGWKVRPDVVVVPTEDRHHVAEVYAHVTFQSPLTMGGLQGGLSRPREEPPLYPPLRKGGSERTVRPLVSVVVPYYNLGPYLPETLASLSQQTYANFEVLVLNDGSTDPASVRVFEEQRQAYPRFRFLSQENAGLGAVRNRGLAEAKGEYFLPVDADNIAMPSMIERFVDALQRNPDLTAMTCYSLLFRETEAIARGQFLGAARPIGGPHALAGLVNVYGDANAIFRSADLRAVAGYGTERQGQAHADWELFIKLVNAGYQLGVVPEHLFYYRERGDSMGQTTNPYQNHLRVLRRCFQAGGLPLPDRIGLWTMLASLYHRLDQWDWFEPGALDSRTKPLRYRLADGINAVVRAFPFGHRVLKSFGESGWRVLKSLSRKAS